MPALVDNPPEPLGESSSPKRKLAAILHADVVGFSRLMGEDEAGTHRALNELRRAVDPLISTHGGRIVVNLGDVIVDGDNIFGDGVNIAARLEALAEPGTVCISQTVYDHVRNKLDLDYHPLGSHRVKNIAEPVRAYAVGEPAALPRPRRVRLVLASASAAVAFVIAGLVAWALHT